MTNARVFHLGVAALQPDADAVVADVRAGAPAERVWVDVRACGPHGERIQGANASVLVSKDSGPGGALGGVTLSASGSAAVEQVRRC